MKWTRVIYISILVIFLSIVTVPFVQPQTNPESNNDIRFLQEAFDSGMWKATLGRLALKQAASQNVKLYGEIMSADHEQYLQTLKRFADQKGFSLTTTQNRVQNNTLVFLSNEYGAAFDRNFMSLMADDNQRDSSLYGAEAKKGQDMDIKAFAARIAKKMDGYVHAAEKILRELPQPLLK